MRVQNSGNDKNFYGIRLSSNSFDKSEELVDFLRKACVDVVGHKTYYVNNDFNSKQRITNYVRSKYRFKEDECGIVFLPWSKEAWVISDPIYEQSIFALIKDFDKKARINFLI